MSGVRPIVKPRAIRVDGLVVAAGAWRTVTIDLRALLPSSFRFTQRDDAESTLRVDSPPISDDTIKRYIRLSPTRTSRSIRPAVEMVART